MPTSLPGRNQAALDDINYDGLTLPIDNVTITYDETQPNGIPAAITGRAVGITMSGGRVVAQLVADGDAIVGRLMRVSKDNFCVYAHRGFVPLGAGTSATVTPGRRAVGALLGALRGYIREAASPGAYAVAAAAEAVRGRGVIYDNNDLNNVLVDLG